jgi:hypothetical protein
MANTIGITLSQSALEALRKHSTESLSDAVRKIVTSSTLTTETLVKHMTTTTTSCTLDDATLLKVKRMAAEIGIKEGKTLRLILEISMSGGADAGTS